MRAFTVGLLVLSGCTASRSVKPLAAGEGEFTSSFGGPLFAAGDWVAPAPVLHLGYRRGLNGTTTLHGGLQPVLLPALGLFAGDFGASHELWKPQKLLPRVMLGGTGFFYIGPPQGGEGPVSGARLFPSVEAVVSWDLGPHTVYTSVSSFSQLSAPLTHLPGVSSGTIVSFGRLALQLEGGWQHTAKSQLPSFAHWLGPSPGAFRAHFGLLYQQ